MFETNQRLLENNQSLQLNYQMLLGATADATKEVINADENETSYIAHYTTGNNYYELSENGTFITTVVANMGEKMPMKFIYKEYAYNSSAEPYDEDTDDGDNTLLVVLLVLILIIIKNIVVLVNV